MGSILFFVGGLIAFIGSIMIIINAFKESVLWGLGCLLINPVIIIYVLLNFGDNWKYVAMYGIGIVILICGFSMIPAAESMSY